MPITQEKRVSNQCIFTAIAHGSKTWSLSLKRTTATDHGRVMLHIPRPREQTVTRREQLNYNGRRKDTWPGKRTNLAWTPQAGFGHRGKLHLRRLCMHWVACMCAFCGPLFISVCVCIYECLFVCTGVYISIYRCVHASILSVFFNVYDNRAYSTSQVCHVHRPSLLAQPQGASRNPRLFSRRPTKTQPSF